MQKGFLHTETGEKKQVYLLEEKDLENSQFGKKNWKEHVYMGYLIIGTIAFGLGIAISLKRLNGK
jgi:hypothetical protein